MAVQKLTFCVAGHATHSLMQFSLQRLPLYHRLDADQLPLRCWVRSDPIRRNRRKHKHRVCAYACSAVTNSPASPFRWRYSVVMLHSEFFSQTYSPRLSPRFPLSLYLYISVYRPLSRSLSFAACLSVCRTIANAIRKKRQKMPLLQNHQPEKQMRGQNKVLTRDHDGVLANRERKKE